MLIEFTDGHIDVTREVKAGTKIVFKVRHGHISDIVREVALCQTETGEWIPVIHWDGPDFFPMPLSQLISGLQSGKVTIEEN